MPSLIKNIAVTDFEMSGLDPLRCDIVEFGLIIVHCDSLDEIARYDKKVRLERPENADASSLAFLGYREEDWKDAIALETALAKYAALVSGSIFAAWNTPFDWTFLAEAFRRKGIKNTLDYHTIDIFSLAYEKLKDNPDVDALKLSSICKYFDIPKEPMPHRAINGAECALAVYKKLRELP
jgi:DNA polymerase III epsilon subunit-like protein